MANHVKPGDLQYDLLQDWAMSSPVPYNWIQQTAEAKIARKYDENKVNFSWKGVVTSAYLLDIFL